MREDIAKVIVTRPRRYGYGNNQNKYDRDNKARGSYAFKGVDVDLSPKMESMRARHIHHYGGKELSDYLSPVYRYLEKNIGNKWDDVWSDICKSLKPKSMMSEHVRDHIKQWVGGVGHGNHKFQSLFDSFVVDENGILRAGNRQYYKHKPKVYHYHRESDTVEYHNINGCWYRIECVPHEYIDYMGMKRVYHDFKKKALNSRTAKKMNLNSATSNKKPNWEEPHDCCR